MPPVLCSRWSLPVAAGDEAQPLPETPKLKEVIEESAKNVGSALDLVLDEVKSGYDKIKAEVEHYEAVRTEVKLASGDYIDLKAYEPAMRHLLDTYIRAEESEKVSAFDDLTLVELIVDRGEDAGRIDPRGSESGNVARHHGRCNDHERHNQQR